MIWVPSILLHIIPPIWAEFDIWHSLLLDECKKKQQSGQIRIAFKSSHYTALQRSALLLAEIPAPHSLTLYTGACWVGGIGSPD